MKRNYDINVGPTASNGGNNRDHNQIPVTRDSRDSRDDREDSGSEEDSGAKIRVGKDYQVITPNWVPPERKYPLYNISTGRQLPVGI